MRILVLSAAALSLSLSACAQEVPPSGDTADAPQTSSDSQTSAEDQKEIFELASKIYLARKAAEQEGGSFSLDDVKIDTDAVKAAQNKNKTSDETFEELRQSLNTNGWLDKVAMDLQTESGAPLGDINLELAARQAQDLISQDQALASIRARKPNPAESAISEIEQRGDVARADYLRASIVQSAAEPDKQLLMKILKRSATGGHVPAMHDYATLLLLPSYGGPYKAESYYWYLRASNAGWQASSNRLLKLLYDGKLSPEIETDKGVLIALAALPHNQNEFHARLVLAEAKIDGEYRPKDLDAARRELQSIINSSYYESITARAKSLLADLP